MQANKLVAGLEEQKSHFHPVVSRAFSGKSWVQICGGQHHSIALDSEGELLLSWNSLVSLRGECILFLVFVLQV